MGNEINKEAKGQAMTFRKGLGRHKVLSSFTVVTFVLVVLLSIAMVSFLYLSDSADRNILNSSKEMFGEELFVDVDIEIFMKDSETTKQVQAVQKEIQASSEVESVKFISKKEAFEEFKRLDPEGFKELNKEELEKNQLPASLRIKLKKGAKADKFVADLKKSSVIKKAMDDVISPDMVSSALGSGLKGLILFIGVPLLVILTIIFLVLLIITIVKVRKDIVSTQENP